MKQRLLNILLSLAFVLLFVGIFFVISNFVGIVYELVYIISKAATGLSSLDTEAMQNNLYQNSVYFPFIEAVLLLPIYGFVMWLRKENIKEFCGFTPISRQNLLLTALIGTVLVLPTNFLVSFFGIDRLSPGTEKIFETMFSSNALPVLLLSVGLVGPILEELVFRGLVLNELKRHLPISISIILQGLLFGVIHFNLTQGIYGSVLGILFGIIYVRVKSIWGTIMIHIFFNSAGILFGSFLSQGALMNWYLTVLSIIGSVFLILLLKRFSPKKNTSIT